MKAEYAVTSSSLCLCVSANFTDNTKLSIIGTAEPCHGGCEIITVKITDFVILTEGYLSWGTGVDICPTSITDLTSLVDICTAICHYSHVVSTLLHNCLSSAYPCC